MQCPICKGIGDLPTIEVNLQKNSILYADQSLILSPRETEIFYAVYTYGPINRDALIFKIFGVAEPDSALNNITVLLWRLRHKLPQIGLNLVNLKPHGFASHASYIITKGDSA